MKKTILGIFLLGFLLLVVGNVSAVIYNEQISFLYEDDFEGVSGDTSSWSTNNAMVNLGTSSWDLDFGSVRARIENEAGQLTHRGTRGLGVNGMENDEVDSKDGRERIGIILEEPVYFGSVEVRSLFVPEGEGAPEEGDVMFYLGDELVFEDHFVGTPSGVVIKNYDGLVADRVVFFVKAREDYTEYSEFAVARINFANECRLVIEEPFEGSYFDDGMTFFDSEAVPFDWHLEGYCTPVDEFDIWYEKDGDCGFDDGSWLTLESDIAPGLVENPGFPDYTYTWNRPGESGLYCIKIKVSSNGARDVSEHFAVDLAPPVVSLEVGDNHFGDCTAHGEGDCYVNMDTDITVTCSDDNPDEPWQSGVDYMRYRYKVNDGEWTKWAETEGTFSFPEDSNHVLEYECYDNVGKKDEGTKNFIVDSVGPVFVEKTIGDPQYCDGVECDMYVTQDTEICLTYEDPEPHPVGGVQVYCDVTIRDTLELEEKPLWVQIVADEDGCFTFSEDSYHSLECWAEDALGNHDKDENVFEQDIVDSEAPETTLHWHGPLYEFEGAQWINTVSRISLTAYDPEPHPVGLYKTYYRYAQVDDWMCETPFEVQWMPTPKDDPSWMEYTGEEFGLPESCHVVEYYSVDLLGNAETVHAEFVFSDHTAPELDLDVDSPGKNCDNLFVSCEPEWDWKVVKGNSITLSCEDQEPHPSGVDKICWRLDWDGEDMTSERCGNGYMEDGYCCQDTEKVELDIFYEECVHTLEYKCVDNVEKYDEGITVFKVEGTPFTLELEKKWNLISFPFNLFSNNVEEVFSSVDENIEGVWSYENGAWKVYIPGEANTINNVEPGRGYWVKTSEEVQIELGGELFSEGSSLPPAINLDEGWNLIGHYGLMPKPSYCSLFSLVDTQEGHPRWSSLWGYNSNGDYFVPLGSLSFTTPGQGYWLEMDVEDTYVPATSCWGLPQVPN